MIIIREVFHAKPGKASTLAKMFKEVLADSPDPARVLTDVVGQFNTVVIETEVKDLVAFEQRMADYKENAKWREKLAGYTDLYRTGQREMYRIV